MSTSEDAGPSVTSTSFESPWFGTLEDARHLLVECTDPKHCSPEPDWRRRALDALLAEHNGAGARREGALLAALERIRDYEAVFDETKDTADWTVVRLIANEALDPGAYGAGRWAGQAELRAALSESLAPTAAADDSCVTCDCARRLHTEGEPCRGNCDRTTHPFEEAPVPAPPVEEEAP